MPTRIFTFYNNFSESISATFSVFLALSFPTVITVVAGCLSTLWWVIKFYEKYKIKIDSIMRKLKQLLGAVLTFITNKNIVNVGCAIAAVLLFVFFKKNFIYGIAIGANATVFIMTNLYVRNWAVKQYRNLINKF